MKKNKLQLSLFILLFLSTVVKAQMSGVYSINSASATSGSNFISFTSFCNQINSVGVSGAVTVNVVANSGPYNEQIIFNQITGASATNSIVINGNGSTLTYSSSNSSQPYTLLMNGTDYFSINNLTITAGGTYGYAVMLCNGADYNRFNNLLINVPANTTSSNHIPIVFSGASSNYYTASNSGSYNTFSGCTIKSGYFSIVHYGNTGFPYNTDNTFSNCNITDWYYYGVYSYYAKNLTITGCTVDRPSHNAAGFAYGFYMYYNQGCNINANKIRNFWGASPGNTNGAYPIYIYYNPFAGTGVQQNKIQNNIISDMNNNSYVYGVYSYYQNGFIQNNSIILNNLNNTYTGTFYGMYAYAGGSSYPLDVKNNLMYFKMSGSSFCYGIYYPTSSGISSDYNDYFMANLAGTQYVAYYNGDRSTVANLISAGTDANSVSLDPFFLAPSLGNYMPTSYPLNNKGTSVGITLDINGATRGTIPDIGAIEFLNVPCSGVPAANSVVSPTIPLCSGSTVALNFLNTYTLSGLTFQWQSASTGSAGVYTAIGGANTQFINSSTITANTWYNAIVTCTNSGQSLTVTPGQINVATTTTNSIPYSEGFENLNIYNPLPNCSWATSNASICKTYTSSNMSTFRYSKTGNNYASFSSNTNSNGDYFYTNGLQLFAGATYSMNINYVTDGYSGWNEFRVLYGASQSTTGLTSIASATNNLFNTTYSNLTNTFVVPSSGIYYIAVKCIGNGSSFNLSWDDLSITAPCSLNNLSVTVNSGSVCAGQSFTMTGSGANTYTYSSGSAVVSPTTTSYYTVSGTSSVGCVSTAPAISFITVVQPPVISAASATICAGNSFVMQPGGASTYTYSNGSATVTPATTSSYSITGTSANGCVSSSPAVVNISVTPLPVISVNSGTICSGSTFTISASGANTYTYSSGLSVVSPVANATYSVTGSNSQGCVSASAAIASVSVNPLPIVSVNSGSVCSGNSFTLSPSGASTYTYSSGSAIVTPSVSGYYLVTGSSSLGCVSATSAIALISVIATPTISAPDATICSGASFVLQPSGANNYTYSGGSATVTPLSNTTYSISGSNLSGCVSSSPAFVNITVNSTPSISVNSGSICSGSSFSIVANGANTYTYSSGTSVVSPTLSTNYSVTGTSSLGCVSSAPAIASVTVFETPVIIANSGSICAGNSFTLNPTGASNYTFSNGNAVVTPTATTSYSVTGTSSAGCVSPLASVATVSVFALPTVIASSSNSILCTGETATLSANGASSYVWNTSATTASIVVSPTNTTSYTVTGTDAFGCVNTFTLSQNVSACLGISNKNLNTVYSGLLVYPNPNNGNFTISAEEDIQLSIINELGQLIEVITLNNNNQHQAVIKDIANGIYFITGHNSAGSVKQKIIVAK